MSVGCVVLPKKSESVEYLLMTAYIDFAEYVERRDGSFTPKFGLPEPVLEFI